MKSAHTPTPWKQYAYGEQIYGTQHPEKEGNFVCVVQSHFAKEDAALIVKAVNAHDDLVKALENLIGHESFIAKNFDIHYAHIEEAKAALAKGE